MKTMLTCKTCKEDKPRTQEFYYPVTYKRATGEVVSTFRRECRKCQQPSVYAKGKKYREASKERALLYNSKARAKKMGWDFDLEVTDIVIPERCPLLDIPLYIGNCTIQDNSPSLDRIDSSKGYVKGNVWVVSARANAIKYNATADEILMVGQRLKDKTCGWS